MTICKYTDSAKRDLHDIIEYTVTPWGKQQTIKYLGELERTSIILSHNPNTGTVRNDIYPKLLSFAIKKHVIYYLKQKEGIVVVRILYASMCHKLHSFPNIDKL